MYYIAGGEEKRKDRKVSKSRSEDKVVGFSSASLFPVRKWEAVTRGETMEPRDLASSKVGRTSKTVVAFQIHLCKTRITRARAPNSPNK